ncbi:MAG: 6-bladed beta-propeller [Gemmatimonadetes bacterium]|nr:6-bladed beta-propeller [Gemmatimonadota bacterium]
MSQITRCLIVAVLAIAGFGCLEDSENTRGPDVPADSATVFLSDSGSVDIVRISDLQAVDPPQVEKRLIYSTAADLEFDHVVGAVFLPDSSLVVADRRSSQLTFLDREGNVRARTGREGEGPGEYSWIARIGIGADGTLFVYDRRQRRFTFLDSQGGVTGVERIERSGEVLPLVRLRSGQSLALFEPRPPLPSGLQRGPVFLVLADDSWEVVDTLGVWVGKERHLSREWGEIVVGFGATALFDGRGLHTVVGTNDSLDVTLYEGTAPLTRIRGGHSPRQVTAREKEAWTELYVAMFPEGWRADQRRQLEQSTVRETYPAFGALSVDADGRIWIGDFAKLEEPQRRWTVLGPEGRPIGALSLPVFRPEWYRFREGLGAMGTGAVEVTTSLPKPRHELLDVTAGRIAILRRGELAGEFIEVYEVEIPR